MTRRVCHRAFSGGFARTAPRLFPRRQYAAQKHSECANAPRPRTSFAGPDLLQQNAPSCECAASRDASSDATHCNRTRECRRAQHPETASPYATLLQQDVPKAWGMRGVRGPPIAIVGLLALSDLRYRALHRRGKPTSAVLQGRPSQSVLADRAHPNSADAFTRAAPRGVTDSRHSRHCAPDTAANTRRRGSQAQLMPVKHPRTSPTLESSHDRTGM